MEAAAEEEENRIDWRTCRQQKPAPVAPRLCNHVMLILGRPVVVPCEASSSLFSLGWMLLLIIIYNVLKIIYSAVHFIVSIVSSTILSCALLLFMCASCLSRLFSYLYFC